MAIAIIENDSFNTEVIQHLEKLLNGSEAFVVVSENGFCACGVPVDVMGVLALHIKDCKKPEDAIYDSQ